MTTTQTKTATHTAIAAIYIARHRLDTMYTRGQWWHYGKGIWYPIHDLQMSLEVWGLLSEFERRDNLRPTITIKNSVLDLLKSEFYVAEAQVDAIHHMINLQNGIYDLESGELLDHKPEYYMTTQLPFAYDKKAAVCMLPLYLLSTFTKPHSMEHDPELVVFLQEAVGYSLTTSVDQHVIFLCYGEGANGKGVLFHMIEQLAGVAAVPLDVNQLRRERYQLANLAGKKVALCSETSATQNLVEDALIKSLVSGDTMMVRQIYREPFALWPTCKLWWSMNELPPVADTSEGFWRRIRVIPFNRQFNDADQIKDLKQQLDKELPGIFNWAMTGLRRLRAQNTFTRPTQIVNLTAQYRKDSNPVASFVDEECCTGQTDPAGPSSSAALYAAYKNWCTTSGFKNLSIKNFKYELERLGFYYCRTGQSRFFKNIMVR